MKLCFDTLPIDCLMPRLEYWLTIYPCSIIQYLIDHSHDPTISKHFKLSISLNVFILAYVSYNCRTCHIIHCEKLNILNMYSVCVDMF